MSQFDSYNEQLSSSFRDALRNLINSSISDDQIKVIIKEMLSNNYTANSTNNSQFGDH